MAKKKMWKEWVIDYIGRTRRCPGEFPSFGLPTDLVTKDEFESMIGSAETHEYKDCHYIEGVLGISEDINKMEEVKVHEKGNIGKLKDLKDDVKEVTSQKKLAKLKEILHIYVERIRFKKNGSLSVPNPLLKIADYIEEQFSKNND